MDDLISRQAAINAFMTLTSDGDKADWCKWVIEQLPSAQPEIIRCRECRYNDMPPTAANADCTLLYGMNDQNGFCSKADRREV